jgi:transposase
MSSCDGRKLSEAALNERRRPAVKMVLGGATIAVSANQCELAEPTVWGAVKAYRHGGWTAVKVCHGHRPLGAGRALNPNQEREVQRLIRDHVPDQLKVNYALWTRQAVGELIARRFAIHLAVRAVGEYLKRWGFTPQRPLKKAHEQSPAAVDRWVNEEYPKIAQAAKTEGAEVHWGHETGLRSDDVRGRSYAPKGKTPVVVTNANRSKLSVLSTVTNKGQMRWKVFSGALHAKILIGFMKRLVHGREKRGFLILDNLCVHHYQAGEEMARGK